VGGGESHQSGVPSHLVANLADPAELRDTNHVARRNGQHSLADAGSIGPSALPASAAMTGSASAQQIAANGEHQRARAVPVTRERRPMHGRTTVLAALPQPRHAASAVADVAASHGALNGPILLIEGVRTHVSTISTGALAVFRVSSTPNSAAPAAL
jgi:hypothetical protein